jgi:hypothetical protein
LSQNLGAIAEISLSAFKFATKKDQRKGWSVPFNELMTSMVRLQCLLN